MSNIDHIIKEFERVRDLPYHIPLDETEEDTCCAGKCVMLKKFLEEEGYNVKYRVCTFKWSSLPIPKKIVYLSKRMKVEHVFLEVEIDGERVDVDPTRDSGLAPLFTISERDGKTSTLLAVEPIELLDDEQSNAMMEDEEADRELRQRNYDFLDTLNTWLETVRKK